MLIKTLNRSVAEFRNMKKIIFAICTMFALSANAKTELITVQGDHGKLDVKIRSIGHFAGCDSLQLLVNK